MKNFDLKLIDHKLLRLCDLNPRDILNLSKEDCEKMQTNIQNNGINEPLIVRKNKDETYGIIKGQRRFLAFRQLKKDNKTTLNEILCLVGNYSDEEVMKIGISEGATTLEIPFSEWAAKVRELKKNVYPDLLLEDFAEKIGLTLEVVEDCFQEKSPIKSFAPKIKTSKVSKEQIIWICPKCHKTKTFTFQHDCK